MMNDAESSATHPETGPTSMDTRRETAPTVADAPPAQPRHGINPGGVGPFTGNMYYVKNWTKFQHYKDRRPPWIKLYRTLLDDCVYLQMPAASRALAPLLWLLASESEDGSIPASTNAELAFRLRLTEREIESAIKPLIANGYISASNALAGCKQDAMPETERETEKETYSSFEVFWKAYPRKTGKKIAFRSWKRAKDKPPLPDILAALERAKKTQQWQRESGRYIPFPATWLNQGRWCDEIGTGAQASTDLMKEFLTWKQQDKPA